MYSITILYVSARCIYPASKLSILEYREKQTRETHTRGDAKASGGEGGGGLGEKGNRATITHKFSIPPGNLGTPQSVKTVTANVPQLIVFTTNGSSPQQLSLALSRASRFARPNGRAFSQDTLHIAFFIRKIEWSTLHGKLCKWHQI